MVDVNGSIPDLETYLGNLLVFLSLTDHIELKLSNCPGFIEAVWPCIDLYGASFIKCSFNGVELNMTEQDLILQMSSLESLQMTCKHPPEYLLSHLDRFKHLKELVINLHNDMDVVRFFPDTFKELRDLEKLVLKNVNLSKDSAKLAAFIAAFSNLICFHLECDHCPEFMKVFEGLSRNENIQEINLRGRFLHDSLMVHLASLLPLFLNLKVFNIKDMYFQNMEKANTFVVALPNLARLEEIYLPGGCGIRMIPQTIIQQFQYLRNLRIISFPSNVLNDGCLLQLGKLVDNLPKLNSLSISRAYGREIKADPLTFIALVQCVARLPSLRNLYMYSWLLDEKDIEMFNVMKTKHPQGQRFELQWQWFLPFPAIVKD
uniref:Uncharacterized protein n=1 Tax=Xenopus tropicalis TaxID=8364 RepID=A0A6I8PY79_XENTR